MDFGPHSPHNDRPVPYRLFSLSARVIHASCHPYSADMCMRDGTLCQWDATAQCPTISFVPCYDSEDSSSGPRSNITPHQPTPTSSNSNLLCTMSTQSISPSRLLHFAIGETKKKEWEKKPKETKTDNKSHWLKRNRNLIRDLITRSLENATGCAPNTDDSCVN